MLDTERDASSRVLRCMEIWGGNALMESSLALPGLDGWVFSRPIAGSTQGGDLHYVSLCGGGMTTRAVVADVSGHGSSVGELAAALRQMVRKDINRKDQTGLVRSLNRRFAELAQTRKFATAIVMTYLATSRRLTLCNAGHPRPLWYRAKTGVWSALASDVPEAPGMTNLPLGIDDETTYDQFSMILEPGDVVVLYTDALIEAANGSGKMLGETGLLELAGTLDPLDASRFGPSLVQAVERYQEGRAAEDDTTVLTLHHTAKGRKRMSLGEKLDVYARFFGFRPV